MLGVWLYGDAYIGKLVMDHRVCRRKMCINPLHLFPCTHRENTLQNDVRSPLAINHRKTHCLKGHPFNETNTHYTKNGGRECSVCRKFRNRTTFVGQG